MIRTRGRPRFRRYGLPLGLLMLLSGGFVGAQKWWPPKPLPGYNIFNEQQEIWLGEVLAEEMQINDRVVDDPEATAYVQAVADRLAAKSKRPGLRYQAFLFDSAQPDAFALPGGRIYVTRGMILFCQSEAELAAAMAHETAHVVLRQAPKTFSRWLAWGPGITRVEDKEDIRAKLVRLEQHFRETDNFQKAADLFFGLTRGDEMWADKYGIWNLHAAGYEPTAAISLFRRYDALQKQTQSADPWRRLLELLLSAHPPPGDRANLLQLELPWMKAQTNPTLDTDAFRALKARLAEAAAPPPPR